MKWKLFSCLLFILFILGCKLISAQNVLVCQGDSTKSANYTNECKCGDGTFYNAFLGKCQDICQYYGDNICGENTNATCTFFNETSLTEKNCSCKPGFTLSVTSDIEVCEDIDECTDSTDKVCDDTKDEGCVNVDGSYECVCKSGFFRNEIGICQEIDTCNFPQDSNRCKCDQICKFENSECSCDCNVGFIKVGNACKLDTDNYEDCDCGFSSDNSYCARKIVDNSTYCYPKLGYQNITVDNEAYIIDINECNDNSYQCYTGQHCVNTNGSYACECDEDYELDLRLEKCVKKECEPGFALYNNECTDLCGTEIGLNCPYETVCVVDEYNIPFCDCQLGCFLLGSGSSEGGRYLYTLEFDALNQYIRNSEPYSVYRITRAIDSIYGRGSSQLTNITLSNNKIQMAVGVPEAFAKTNDLREAILRHCDEIVSIGVVNKCILPNGLIIDSDSIEAGDLYPCSSIISPCNHTNANCYDHTSNQSIPVGGYQCKCNTGYERAKDLNEFYCIDINECLTNLNYCIPSSDCVNTDGSFYCGTGGNSSYEELQKELEQTQQDLDDSEHKTKVVGGVLGAFFGVTIILLVVAGFYILSHHS